MSQLDLFSRAAPAAAVSDLPDPAVVRARMHAKLQELIDAPAMPWSERDLGVWSAMWPQMSRWLPDEERTALIAAFEAQIERLTAN